MSRQPRIQSSYYPVTPEIGRLLRQAKLTAAEWRIWSYLIEIEPWGDRYLDFESLDVMAECSVSSATFYRAIAKFKELHLFDIQDKGFSLKNEHGISKMRMNSQACEKILKNENEFSEMKKDSQNCENQLPEPLPQEGSNSPQIYTDLDQTLSDPPEAADEKINNKSDRISSAASPTHPKKEREREGGLKKFSRYPKTERLLGQSGVEKEEIDKFIKWVENKTKKANILLLDEWLTKDPDRIQSLWAEYQNYLIGTNSSARVVQNSEKILHQETKKEAHSDEPETIESIAKQIEKKDRLVADYQQEIREKYADTSYGAIASKRILESGIKKLGQEKDLLLEKLANLKEKENEK